MRREMMITDICTLSDGRTVYLLSSDSEQEIHVGDVLIDSKGNRSVVTGVWAATKCFSTKYSFSLMLDGKAEQGKASILKKAEKR